ncbi:hypothetical protein BLNAU_1969 [Blattamonas nauphoetae]|uniref:Uncharacterized protein n=1 Tax=Blattamonas nauphoetae TaxID=2049346 RepID=A0ABQ9YH09_9EUKA|nr:hypothetical protein BLNAU_24558 [Blattamonas nauphoetae]KAK2942990.1 hypothetical protein BLNAU_22105 [Blattamonas nauphoetae]KAK2962946.1 hypothetical protein BLNAU_1969 [Blattamonas nauphoetae]
MPKSTNFSTVPEAKLSIWEWKRDDEHQLGASSLDNEYRQHIISSLRFTVDLQVELPTSAPSQRDSAFLTNHKTQIHSTSPANLQCDLMCRSIQAYRILSSPLSLPKYSY